MNREGQKVWGDVLSALKTSISASSFKTWFSGSHVMDFQRKGDSNILVVGVGSGFLKEQIEKRYMPIINDCLGRDGESGAEIVFVVSQKETTPKSYLQAPLLSGVASSHITIGRRADALNTNHIFANLIVGSTNNLAHLAALQVAGNLGKSYNPLVFWGPTGVGKTHMLQAIGNEVMSKYDGVRVLYVTSEKFTNDFLESLSTHTQSAFRSKYRNVDLLLFDDIQFLAGKESTQDEFFHTFNELVMSGRLVVVASDKHPRDLGKIKERLVSRFLGGMCADIGLPDFEMKSSIIKLKCSERGVVLEDGVVSFIAEECGGGARELEGYLTTALAQLRITGTLTVDLLKKSLLGSLRPTQNITQGKITEIVAKHYKTRFADMRGSSRKFSITWARQVAMYMMRTSLGMSYESIGDIFGGRDHSTVMHSIDKVSVACQKSTSTRDEILRLKEALSS